jgi:hypothetical protein
MNKTQIIINELKTNKDVKAAKFGCLAKVAKKFKVSPKIVAHLYRKVSLSEREEIIRKQR